jgi:hypothetical protein
MTKNENWSKATTVVFNGILLYSIAGVLHSIISPIASLISGAGAMASAMGGDGGAGTGGLTVFMYLLSAGIIGGYVLFLIGLTGFAKILDGSDSAAVGKIRTGVILGLVAIVTGFIPLAGGIIGGIINIVAFIMMMIAYSALKKSQTFPQAARRGAGTLFTSQILLIIGAALGLIPFIGAIFDGILGIIAFIMVLVGWSTIRKAQPEPPAF